MILHVGRLSPEKNQADLIDAMRLLGSRGEYRLRIVGDGPSRAALESRAAGDPRISFLGMRAYAEEVPGLYASADIYAQPSPHETFSLTVLEAIAAGLPVVAVGQGGPLDLVGPGRGELARMGDVGDLAAKIEKVALARALYANGRSSLPVRSWESAFERLLAVYDEALSERHAWAPGCAGGRTASGRAGSNETSRVRGEIAAAGRA